MRLTILGPAFGCPSIDPQCNAVIALLKRISDQSGQQWEVVCAQEDFDNLPKLECDGKDHYGFQSIARRLLQDQPLTAVDASLAAFIEHHGQILIDVCHYVSYDNYAGKTRPAFAKILPWQSNYLLPPRRRNAARKRTDHLGISGIDMDDVHDSVLDNPQESMSMAERRYDRTTERRAMTLLGRKRTVRSLLQQPSYAGAFKLKNLADKFYEPLETQLDGKQFLTGDEPASIDCLAWGYLSLLVAPDMPQPWAADILNRQYPRLAQYVERMSRLPGLKVAEDFIVHTTDRVSISAASGGGLPWTALPSQSVLSRVCHFASGLLDQTSLLRSPQPVADDNKTMGKQDFASAYLPEAFASTAAMLAVAGYLAYRTGLWPHGEEVQVFGRRSMPRYATTDSALSVLGALASPAGRTST